MRAVVIIALAGCAASQHARNGVTDVLAAPGSQRVEVAVSLAGGDWLVALDRGLTRVSPDGGVTRWQIAGRYSDAIALGDGAVGIGFADGRRAAFQVDRDGRIGWTVASDTITRAGDGRVVRAGALTVIANAYGELAIDDQGKVRWEHGHRESSDVIAVAVVAGGVAIATNFDPSQPCVIRYLDPDTGDERARVSIAGGGNTRLGDLVALGDDRLVMRLGLDHDHERITVLDGRTAAIVDEFDQPAPLATNRTSLGATEIAYLEHYSNLAQGDRDLGLTIVDVATHHAYRVPLIVLRHVAIGTGLDSFAEVRWTGRTGTTLAFTGTFDGEIRVGAHPLRGPVDYIDSCVAAGHIECSEGHGKTMMSSFVGMFGTIALTRGH
jgi:hypothetical protein